MGEIEGWMGVNGWLMGKRKELGKEKKKKKIRWFWGLKIVGMGETMEQLRGFILGESVKFRVKPRV